MSSSTPPGPVAGGLAAAVALAILLYFGPALAGAAWLTFVPGVSPKTLFAPVELLAILLPTLLLAAGPGWRRRVRWIRAPWAAVGWAAAGAAGWAGLLSYAQTLWQRASGYGPPAGMDSLLAIGSLADFLWLATGAVLLPAVAEESAFRGFMQQKLERFGPVAAIAASAALFAAFHHDMYGLPTYLAMGAFLGWAAWRTGSLWPSVAAHAVNNALALAQMNGLPEAWWWANLPWLAPLSLFFAITGTYRLARPARSAG